MPTLRQLISTVRHRLAGVGAYKDSVLELGADLAPGDLTITVDDAAEAGPGLYEIGLEKIRVKSANADTSSLSVFTFGRGYDGTVAASHTAGAEVTRSPLHPASTIAQEINGVLTEIYPFLYAVKTIDSTYEDQYTLPSDAVGVIAVYASDTTGLGYRRLDRWRWEPDVGKALQLAGLQHGTDIRITYAARPGLYNLDNPYSVDEDFVTVTGLDARLTDLLTLGVAYRLAPFADMGNLMHTGAEARSDQSKPAGRGASLARFLYAEFQQRLQQEQMVLNKEHPIRLHKER